MKKIILILVLVVGLYGEDINIANTINEKKQTRNQDLFSQSTIWAKAYVKSKQGKSRIALQRKDKSTDYRRDEYNDNYISNITATIDKYKVLDASFNNYIWLPPVVEFKFKDLLPNANSILYTLTDNYGKSVKKYSKIKRNGIYSTKEIKQNNNIIKKTYINPKAWEATNTDSAIKALYGEDALKKIEKTSTTNFLNKKQFNNISCLPKDICSLATNGFMEIILETDKELESVSIFSTATDKVLLAVFKISKKNKIYISTKYNLEKFGKIFVIAKTRDEKLYKSESYKISPTGYTEDGVSRTLGFSSK